MQEFETLKQLVTEAEPDVQKAEGGNKAAGTRVRKKMQDIKAAAQDVRKRSWKAGKRPNPPAEPRRRPKPDCSVVAGRANPLTGTRLGDSRGRPRC